MLYLIPPPFVSLIVIQEQELLPLLFGKLFIPQAVFQELTHPHAPASVQRFMKSPPDWIEVCKVSKTDLSLQHLDIGEQEAILLAEEINADLLIFDDKAGRLTAKERGLTITGTLGVLELAAIQQKIGLPQVIEKLLQTNINISSTLIDFILKKYKA